VTVNWRRPDLTIRCLHGVAAGTRRPDLTIVVDNGSGDDSIERIRSAHPKAVVLGLSENTGFTGGYNAGISKALEQGADLVLILNNDAEMEPGALEAACADADAHPECGLFGIGQLLPDGSAVDSFFRLRWSDGRVSLTPPGCEKKGEGWFLSGCAILARRAAIEKLGLFDERFYLYAEDAEWSFRARALGIETRAAPDARVRHELFASSGRTSPVFLYYNSRNLFLLRKYAPGLFRRTLYPVGVFLRLVRKARKLAGRGEADGAVAVADGLWAGFFAGRYGRRREASPLWFRGALLCGSRKRRSGADATDRSPASRSSHSDIPAFAGLRARKWIFLAILALGLAARLAGAWIFGPSGSSDHGVAALMARHVALGKEWPVFYYGQPYMGSIEMILGGFAARFLGINTFTVNLGTALFGFLLLPVVFHWGRKASDANGGLVAMLLCAVGSRYFFQFMSWSYGAYAVNAFLGAALICLAISIGERESEGRRWNLGWFALGLGGGVGWWSNQQIIPALLTAGILLAWMERMRVWPATVLAAPGFALGSLPFWAWNAANDWETFSDLARGNIGAGLAANTASFASRHLPDALGIPRGPLVASLPALLAVAFAFLISRRTRGSGIGGRNAGVWRVAPLLLVALSFVVFGVSCPSGLATPRYMLSIVPAFAVMAGGIAAWLPGRAKGLGWLAAIVLVGFQLAAIPGYITRVRSGYENNRARGMELVEFLRDRQVTVAAVPYLRLHALNWLGGERIVFSEWRDRYPPYSRVLEQAGSFAVAQNPQSFDAFIRQSCGRSVRKEVGGFNVHHDIQPPKGGLVEVPIVSVEAETGGVRSEGAGAVLDGDAGTSWMCTAPSLLTLTLARDTEVADVRILSSGGLYPRVIEAFVPLETTNWLGVGGAVDAMWFWSGPRPYAGRWLRRLEWRLAPSPTRVVRIRVEASVKRPCSITELQVFQPAADEDPAAGSGPLSDRLKEIGADNVYCDRWLANALGGAGGWAFRTPLRPDLYGRRENWRDTLCKIEWSKGTVLVCAPRDADLCRRTLASAGVTMSEEDAGGWHLFRFGPGDYSSLYEWGIPISWVGYGCLTGAAEAPAASEFFCKRGLELLALGRASEGASLIERAADVGVPSRSAMLAAVTKLRDAGLESAAAKLMKKADEAWTISVPARADFNNGIELAGISTGMFNAETRMLPVTYFWLVSETADRREMPTVFVHFFDDTGLAFQDDHVFRDAKEFFNPIRSDRLCAERRLVAVPEGRESAGYQIRIGLLRPGGKRIKPRTESAVHGNAVVLPRAEVRGWRPET
jgi:GT2 family glycosyltransferase/4-amino-4-deoxy-L-arabinose transferase-like glycosyltransferase